MSKTRSARRAGYGMLALPMNASVILAGGSSAGLLPMNRGPVGIGVIAGIVLTLFLAQSFGWRQGALFVVGFGAGIALYHAAFGFTSAWRRVIQTGRSAGLRAQLLMLAATALVFLPLIADGQLWGMELRGNVRPLSLSVAAGAFLFGIGMQLGGGCASGTLFTVGGGSVRMVATLAAFIAGSVLGAFHRPGWEAAAPSAGPVSLQGLLGTSGALAMTLALLAAAWILTVRIERRRHGNVAPVSAAPSRAEWLQGPWPLIAGALGLAAVNVATLVLAGRPWGITSGFALWGSKALAATGVDVASWPYWQGSTALEASVFSDITSVMNMGILLGALTAAGLAGRFAPVWRIPARSLAAALIGGLLLGYGARIAYGCNIGAFFSGVASSSLHGWLWLAAGFAGSAVGIRMRPWFGLGR
ncbi:MAG: YeeE/YedE family protein [Rhodospirillaceae bacterium]|nr:YeeE/YedE family protein [Rhodospirillaceae bacterium]